MLTPTEIEALFTREDGTFLFARWGRPIVPVVFGLSDTTLPVLKGAIEAIVTLAGHKMSDHDPELGANLMVFFVADWAELSGVPNLERLIPDFGPLLDRLTASEANQYRVFRFDSNGAIRAAFVLIRVDDDLSAVPAEALALSQAVQTILLWSDTAFRNVALLLGGPDGETLLRPEIGALIRAAYDPVLPPMAQNPALCYRIAARMDRPA